MTRSHPALIPTAWQKSVKMLDSVPSNAHQKKLTTPLYLVQQALECSTMPGAVREPSADEVQRRRVCQMSWFVDQV